MNEYIAYAGPSFQIEWYFNANNKSHALEFFNDLNEDRQDSVLELFKRMGDAGKISNKEKFRNEGDGVFAFKPQPDRFLRFFTKGKKIIITHAFTKKTRKLSKNDKVLAIERMNDYLKRIKADIYYEKEN